MIRAIARVLNPLVLRIAGRRHMPILGIVHHRGRKTGRLTLTGALTGTRVASGTMTFHPDGTFTAHDTGTFTGTIDGRTGSITISGASSGTGNTGSGQIVGDQGTGGLAGLHLQGSFQPMITGPTTSDGTYSIQFHFGS